MDITDFKRILDETVVPSNLSFQEQAEKIENLYGCAKSMMPKSLFRYRKCDERSIDAFYNDRVWVSSADCMNDGFDARMYFDKNSILEWGAWFLNPSNQDQAIEKLGADKEPPLGMDLFPGMEQMFHAFVLATDEEKRQILTWFGEKVNEEIAFSSGILADISQQTYKFCCLSKRINSASMWGLYANNETGFALEYDCRDLSASVPLENGYQRICNCFPIIYSESRYQVSTEYIQFLLAYRLMNKALVSSGFASRSPDTVRTVLNGFICPDLLVPMKTALHKSSEWEREEEWRLFCSSNDDPRFQNAQHAFFTLKPTGLYLGRRISSIYEKILVGIAKEKSLPIYRMHLDDDTASYKLFDKSFD